MVSLKNFIYKKYYFSLHLQNIFITFPFLIFLRYDSSTSVILNQFRNNCIKYSLKIFLVNSKYITNFFLCKKLWYNFLQNDIILIPFYTLDSLKLFLLNDNLFSFLNFFKIIGLSFNGYLLNICFPFFFNILKNDNFLMYVKNLLIFLVNQIVILLKIFLVILINLLNLFIFTLSFLNKFNQIIII